MFELLLCARCDLPHCRASGCGVSGFGCSRNPGTPSKPRRYLWDYTMLYYTLLLLYYTILYCYYTLTILYYTILYYTILYYTILYYTILYYTVTILLLCYTLLHSAKAAAPPRQAPPGRVQCSRATQGRRGRFEDLGFGV